MTKTKNLIAAVAVLLAVALEPRVLDGAERSHPVQQPAHPLQQHGVRLLAVRGVRSGLDGDAGQHLPRRSDHLGRLPGLDADGRGAGELQGAAGA